MSAQQFMFGPQDFCRQDETDDKLFYAKPRLVSHLDRTALATVERLIGGLVIEERPVILDLMASWDSHLPPALAPGRVVGLGLNAEELRANPALDEFVVADLNQRPTLPWPDATFDVVLNTVSVDYLTRPLAVFAEAGRVLRPGGLFLVTFSDRWFEPKVTRVWRGSSEAERIFLVEELFRAAGRFGPTRVFTSRGKDRPADDKHAALGLPSDPIVAIFADKAGGDPTRRPRPLPADDRHAPDKAELARRYAAVGQTLACPHCGQGLRKWAVPQTPFTEWDNDFMYVCFNDACPYLRAGWDAMSRQGNHGVSYRLMFNPENGGCMPIPVQSLSTLRDGLID